MTPDGPSEAVARSTWSLILLALAAASSAFWLEAEMATDERATSATRGMISATASLVRMRIESNTSMDSVGRGWWEAISRFQSSREGAGTSPGCSSSSVDLSFIGGRRLSIQSRTTQSRAKAK